MTIIVLTQPTQSSYYPQPVRFIIVLTQPQGLQSTYPTSNDHYSTCPARKDFYSTIPDLKVHYSTYPASMGHYSIYPPQRSLYTSQQTKKENIFNHHTLTSPSSKSVTHHTIYSPIIHHHSSQVIHHKLCIQDLYMLPFLIQRLNLYLSYVTTRFGLVISY